MASLMEIHAPAEETEGTRSQILRWLKVVGDKVAEHEPLLEIETDKVTVEVAAPANGVLREILKGQSEDIAPGEVLGRLETQNAAPGTGASARAEVKGGEISSASAAQRAHGVDAPASGSRGADAPASSSLGVDDAPASTSRGGFAAAAEPSPRARATPTSASGSSAPGAQRSNATNDGASLSPAVRRLIAERGLDAASIAGTGEGGRITVDDVLSHDSSAARRENSSDSPVSKATTTNSVATSADRLSQSKQPPKSPVQPASRSTDDVTPRAGQMASHLVPHTAIRKRIADHMVQSLLNTAPHVTTIFEADMTAVIAHRAAHRSDFDAQGAPLTFTAYFLAAAARAIKVVPESNARWTDAALEIYDTINIGVATAIEDVGLVVPVLRSIESKGLFEIAKGLNELVTAARAGKLQPADVRGGTFTISNHGVSGSLLATPIVINQPQSAILGIGKLEKRVTIEERGNIDQVIARPKCYVTLTIDHRVMDGHRANQFLQTFVRTLEAWPAP